MEVAGVSSTVKAKEGAVRQSGCKHKKGAKTQVTAGPDAKPSSVTIGPRNECDSQRFVEPAEGLEFR